MRYWWSNSPPAQGFFQSAVQEQNCPPCFIALYNEASVEIYKDGRLVYYVCAAEDGNLVEVVDGQFVYTTETTDPVRDETTGVTTRRTTVRGTDTALELLTANDAFGRKQQTGTLLRDLSGTQEAPEFAAILADYTYKTVGDGETPAATGQVDTLESRVTYGTTMQGENTVARYGFAYDYDANGNITHEYAVAENGTRTLRYRYTYDEANQLTRVDDNTQGRTHVYEYDRGGNRVSEKLYAYTLGAVGGDPQEEIVSYYGPRLDSVEGLFRGWYDVLRTYDGKGIQYDRSGNPVSYDGKTFTWNGKQLTKITAADGSCTEFAYDANGIRTQKRQFAPDGTLEYFVDYVWQDGLLTHQNMTYFLRVTVNGETRVAEVPFSAKILYDENDMPVGSMVSDEGAVGYVRNLQGDIVALVSPEGEVLVEYSYDPWGNVTVSHDGEAVEGLEAAIVAVFCPFAYRGYNYDFTTGLYYLQSRYYNPEWGRFLNVDDTNILLASQGESLGANLFAYCGNNPVNLFDPSGKRPEQRPIVKISVYDGPIGHAEIRLGLFVFSYGVYANYNNLQRIIGCPATMVVVVNPYAWYKYDAQTNGNRKRTDISINVTQTEYMLLYVFYLLVAAYSSEQEEKNDGDWVLCRLTNSSYETYRLATTNCVTVILDALSLAMPAKYYKAMGLYYMIYRIPVIHPQQLQSFARILAKVS